MDFKEINQSNNLWERDHWWIKTRFGYIDKALSYLKNDQISIMEFGCGTGQNLWFAKTCSFHKNRIHKVIGIDINMPQSFRPNWSDQNDRWAQITGKEFKSDIILAMDVLEHIDDDLNTLQKWTQNLKSGGIMLITVPAFQSLWSYHDDFLEHKRRYQTHQIDSIAKKCGLQTLYLKYAFGYLFPAVYFVRRILNTKKQNSDLRPSSAIINKTLYGLGNLERKCGGNPWIGTSVVGIFKKA